jgi:hypothetical protein
MIHLQLILAALMVTMPETASATNDGPSLQVFTIDSAGLPQPILARAEQNAARILGAAGVKLRWYDCARPGAPGGVTAACREPIAPSDLWVRLLPQNRHEYRVRSGIGVPYQILGHALCNANNTGTYINIYWKSLLMQARGDQERSVYLLGYALAHEIGHILLGPHTTGIMASDWAEKDVLAAGPDEFLFCTADSKRLVERVRERLVSASPGPKR